MRHKVKTRRLGRFSSLRKATVNSIARATIINQSVRTTFIKAKATVPVVERLISLAKKGTLAAKRDAFRILLDHALVSRLFGEVAGLFKNRSSGYTKILKIGRRRGDGAQIAILELTEKSQKEKRAKKEKAPAKKEEHPPDEPKEKSYPAKEEKPKDLEKKERPPKSFFGGLRGFFKKERDSL